MRCVCVQFDHGCAYLLYIIGATQGSQLSSSRINLVQRFETFQCCCIKMDKKLLMPEEEKIFEENYSDKTSENPSRQLEVFTQVFWNHSEREVKCCFKDKRRGEERRGEERRGEERRGEERCNHWSEKVTEAWFMQRSCAVLLLLLPSLCRLCMFTPRWHWTKQACILSAPCVLLDNILESRNTSVTCTTAALASDAPSQLSQSSSVTFSTALRLNSNAPSFHGGGGGGGGGEGCSIKNRTQI